MAEEQKGLITIRGLNWGEYEALIEYQKELNAPGEVDPETFLKKSALFVLDKFYGLDANLFGPMEVITIYRATIIRSNEVRADEIKNLPPSLIGILNEAATAPTAEKSTSNEEQTQTAEAANIEDQK